VKYIVSAKQVLRVVKRREKGGLAEVVRINLALASGGEEEEIG